MKTLQLLPALVLACLMPTCATAQTQPAPVNPAWAGEWRAIDFNLPPADRVLITRRDAATSLITTTAGGAECTAGYDGVVQAAAIVTRIEERAKWQLKAENWPAGTDPAQLVGLKKEFDEALRLGRSLPPDAYRRVRFNCPAADGKEDRYYILNEGRRLFEFRFPENGLSLRVTLFERVR